MDAERENQKEDRPKVGMKGELAKLKEDPGSGYHKYVSQDQGRVGSTFVDFQEVYKKLFVQFLHTKPGKA